VPFGPGRARGNFDVFAPKKVKKVKIPERTWSSHHQGETGACEDQVPSSSGSGLYTTREKMGFVKTRYLLYNDLKGIM
jgi:hypothetical protein